MRKESKEITKQDINSKIICSFRPRHGYPIEVDIGHKLFNIGDDYYVIKKDALIEIEDVNL